MKRCVDILGAIAGLLVLWPVLAAIAFAIRRDSPGPALFLQKRVGRFGRVYDIYKFRSMVAQAPSQGAPTTQVGDPRITRIGRILRKFSLDELPQLFNVLKGEMSLVGPRPELPIQRINYSEEEWTIRHRVRPGLTGWAQVNGRHFIEPGRRKTLDLQYAQKLDLALDVRIVILTLREIFLRGTF